VNNQTVGNCLQLFLQHYPLLHALDELELPIELKEESQLLEQFDQRASEQASLLLEALHGSLFSSPPVLPYRAERKSQKRTVREQWYMEGPFFRSRERMARNIWSLYLCCFKDSGPSACLILSSEITVNRAASERLAAEAATLLGLRSASPESCFTHYSGFESGVVIGQASLHPSMTHEAVARSIRDQSALFFSKLRAQFEASLDAP
jgi:hypothetical protein